MCMGGSRSPAPPPVAPEAAVTPEQPSDAGGSAVGKDSRRKRKAAGVSNRSTILTSSRGADMTGQTAQKTLLGS